MYEEVITLQDPMRMSFDEFARHLQAVFDTMAKRGEKVFMEKEGVLFRLEAENAPQKADIWADYDPEKVRQGLKKSAGALKGVDHEALKKDIQSQRQQDSHGRPA
jgi:hypothetical protein